MPKWAKSQKAVVDKLQAATVWRPFRVEDWVSYLWIELDEYYVLKKIFVRLDKVVHKICLIICFQEPTVKKRGFFNFFFLYLAMLSLPTALSGRTRFFRLQEYVWKKVFAKFIQYIINYGQICNVPKCPKMTRVDRKTTLHADRVIFDPMFYTYSESAWNSAQNMKFLAIFKIFENFPKNFENFKNCSISHILCRISRWFRICIERGVKNDPIGV